VLLLLTSKFFYVVLFHGRKGGNDDGLSMVTTGSLRQKPHPLKNKLLGLKQKVTFSMAE